MRGARSPGGFSLWLLGPLLATAFTGCAALTNPVKDGVPVSAVPEELLAKPKEVEHPLPLSLLGQTPPAAYRLAPGDTLGVWIEGVLAASAQGPPVYQSQGRPTEGPRLGYPIPVQEDGTITLPLVPPINVRGMTVQEAEAAIRTAYTVTRPILKPDQARILVNLLRRRHYHVVVLRDEVQNYNNPGAATATIVVAATQKRGNGHALDLPAGENDVLNAIGRSGGTPGLDAYNEIIVEHRNRTTPAASPNDPAGGLPCVVRIPLRLPPHEPPPFSPQDVILDDGDVVYLPERDIERFYTGGLLPPGEYLLPRNYDLDVVEAVAFVRGPLVNGAYGLFGGTAGYSALGNFANNGGSLAGRLITPGVGGPSPSLLTVLRRLPGGGQFPIVVDLNRALTDPSERLIVKAGDVLILQETPCQAVARYFIEFLDKFTFNFAFQRVSRSSVTTGSGIVQIPAPPTTP